MGNGTEEARRRKIGVLDSGVGGLTVVRELERLLPDEDIIYYGDNGNCPYGNRTEEDIVGIARGIIDFLRGQNVKLVVLACNTTSSLLHRIRPGYELPIFGVIEPAAHYVAERGFTQVGVIATELTIRSGSYERLIHEHAPGVRVVGEPSRTLAKLVDSGEFDMEAITAEVRLHMRALLSAGVEQVIYGCTHYPIVGDVFEAQAPGVEFINPARCQALAVKHCLEEAGLCNDAPLHQAQFYTTGGPEAVAVYKEVFRRLDLKTPATFAQLLRNK